MKKLYIFDFDQTLVKSNGKMRVCDENGKCIKEISYREYCTYKLQPGESFDYSNFEAIVHPVINHELFNKLKEYKKDSVILTARSLKEPVVKFLTEVDCSVPVNAVGIYVDGQNTHNINAKRKKSFIKKAIEARNYNYIEFWDDDPYNIQEAESLKEEFPEVQFVLHLVEKFNG